MLFTRSCSGVVVALVLLAAPGGATTVKAQESARGNETPGSQVREYQDWSVECRRPEGADAQDCVMFQRQSLKDGRTLLLMSVQHSASGGAPFVVLQVPLGVLLGPGLTITVDDREPRVMGYRLCNPNGCMVTFPLNQEMRSAFVEGETARVEMTTGDGKPLGVEVSLLGFTAALNTL